MRVNSEPGLEFLFCSAFMNKKLFYLKTNTHISFVICGRTDLIKYWLISCFHFVPLEMSAICFLFA